MVLTPLYYRYNNIILKITKMYSFSNVTFQHEKNWYIIKYLEFIFHPSNSQVQPILSICSFIHLSPSINELMSTYYVSGTGLITLHKFILHNSCTRYRYCYHSPWQMRNRSERGSVTSTRSQNSNSRTEFWCQLW